MYQFLTKNGQALAFVLGLVLIVVFFLFAGLGAGEYNFETMDAADKAEVTVFDFGLKAAIVLAIIAILAALGFGIMQVASDPKGSLKGILGLVAIIVIFVIGYSMSAGEPESAALVRSVANFEDSQSAEMTTGNYKFIGGGMIAAMVLLILAVLTMVVTGVLNFFKR